MGYENCDIIESVFLQFYKIVLCFKKSTFNNILYGELGRFPSNILIKSRMIGFWKRLVCGKQGKISVMLYNLIYNMHLRNIYTSKWLKSIENTLNLCGYSEYWLNQTVPEQCCLSRMIKARLVDQFKQTWYSDVYDSPKCLNYRIFKTTHCYENYLNILPSDLRIALSKFRCVNHKLPIEKGRFYGIARDDRICELCNSGNLGDEYHYLFECSFLKPERKKFLPLNFAHKHNVQKFYELFNSEDPQVTFKLAKFCKLVLALFK